MRRKFQPPPFTQEGIPLRITFHHKQKPYVIESLSGRSTAKDLENEIKKMLHGVDENGVTGKKYTYNISYNSQKIVGETRLSQYNMQGNIQIGVWVAAEGGTTEPKKVSLDLDTRNISFKDHKEVPKVMGKCIMFGDKDELCAKMDCGCLVSPAGMRGIIQFILNKKEFPMIYCPICDSVKKKTMLWNYQKCLWVADIKGENYDIISRVFYNREKDFNGLTKECPNCLVSNRKAPGVFVYRIRCTCCEKDFCFECSKSWKGYGMIICGNKDCDTWKKQEDLNKSTMLSVQKDLKNNNTNRIFWLERVDNKVPEKRACPNCYHLLEHMDKCPHIGCTACGHDFCWICLGDNDKSGHSWLECSPVGIQKLG